MPSPKSPAARPAPVATMSASEFKATCLEVMDDVARTHGEVIVTKHGRPVIRVSAADVQIASPWGALAGSVVRHGDIVSPDDALWETSATDPLAKRPTAKRRVS